MTETVRSIRSYVLRQGRMSNAQKRAYDNLLGRYAIPFSPGRLDFGAAFGRDAAVIVEIGFGMGETTAQIAQAHPEQNYLGLEVHSPGVGSLLKLIEHDALTNLRIIQHDAVDVLEHMLAPESLAGLHIFCADIPPLRSLGGSHATYFSPDADAVELANRIVNHLAFDSIFHMRVRARRDFSWEGIYMRQIAPLLAL